MSVFTKYLIQLFFKMRQFSFGLKANKGKIILFSIMIIVFIGARENNPEPNLLDNNRIKPYKSNSHTTGMNNNKRYRVFISPIFKDGRGLSVFDKDKLCSGYPIKESKAREIINKAFEGQNLNFSSNIPSEIIPVFQKTVLKATIIKGKEKFKEVRESFCLDIDGYNSEHNIGYYFISHEDFLKYYKNRPDERDTLQVENYLQLAETLRKNIRNNKGLNIFFYYEPMCCDGMSDKLNSEEKRLMVEGLLLEQQKQSINWLKKKGIIE